MQPTLKQGKQHRSTELITVTACTSLTSFLKNVQENVEHGKHMHSETCFALVLFPPEWKRLLSDHVNCCG